MFSGGNRGHYAAASMLVLLALIASAQSVLAEGATRDLSNFSGPGAMFTVSIAIDAPIGADLAILEDAPPSGWTVSDISDGGSWDEGVGKVKWLFWTAPPALVTDNVTPPADATGEHCFSGTVAFTDSEPSAIGGDTCGVIIPTLSEWGLLAMALLVLIAGTSAIRDRVLKPPS